MTSVIIPTYQGQSKIGNCIDALLNQSIKDFQIIIAIDGSTDLTEVVVRDKLKNHTNYKILKQENKGRASIRNFGAKAANGDLLIFYDDDMRPVSDSIDRHISFHKNNINQVLQGVQITDRSKLNSDILKYKFFLECLWEKQLREAGTSLRFPYLSGAHFSISKVIFTDVNGFDEKLTDAEDFDLSIRLAESGIRIHYDHKNIAYHDDFITLKTYINRKRDYAKAHARLNVLYPKRYLKHSQRSFIPRTGWKALFYRIISSKKLVEMIDNEHPAILTLPKNIRYRLYDLLIQGLSNYYPNKTL